MNDRLGIQVVEGDILVDENFLYVIEKFEGSFNHPYIYLYIEGKIVHEIGRKMNDLPFDTSDKLIIGNKFDDPELLKTKLS